MKKITVVSLASFIFLFICSLVAKITMPFFSDYATTLIIGVSVLEGSGLLAFIVRENVKTKLYKKSVFSQ